MTNAMQTPLVKIDGKEKKNNHLSKQGLGKVTK